jgi:hypothetical protein
MKKLITGAIVISLIVLAAWGLIWCISKDLKPVPTIKKATVTVLHNQTVGIDGNKYYPLLVKIYPGDYVTIDLEVKK